MERLRLKQGLTWRQVGEQLGVGVAMLMMLKSGRRNLSKKVQYRLEEWECRTGLSAPGAAARAGMEVEALTHVQKQLDELAGEVKNLKGLRFSPVVSWASAGAGGNYADLEGFLNERIPTDCKDPNSFALIVEGDSMEPECHKGDRIIVAPNVSPRNGDLVVARLEEEGEVLFKQFHETGKGVKLTSLNAAYKPLVHAKKEFRFIYPVHSVVRKYHKG
ncbi:MAG: LexA family transcriptional regulator [Verrucomicrobiota bacterium]